MPSPHVLGKLAAAGACLFLLSACAMWGPRASTCTCPPASAVAATTPAPAQGEMAAPAARETKVASASAAKAAGTPTPQASPAPKPASVSAEQPSGAVGRIYFYRAALIGTVMQPDVLLNGKIVGKAVPKEYFYVDRPPGAYEVTSSMPDTRSLSFTLEPGTTAYVEVNVIPKIIGGRVIPLLAEESEGKEALKHRHQSAR